MSPVVAIVSSKGQITVLRKRPRVDATWAAGLSTTLSEGEDTLDDEL